MHKPKYTLRTVLVLLSKGKRKSQMWLPAAFWMKYPPEQTPYDSQIIVKIDTWRNAKKFSSNEDGQK